MDVAVLVHAERQPEPLGPALGDPDLLGAGDAGDVVVLDAGQVPDQPGDGVGLGVGSPGQVVVAEAGDEVGHLLADAARGRRRGARSRSCGHSGTRGADTACHAAARDGLVWAAPGGARARRLVRRGARRPAYRDLGEAGHPGRPDRHRLVLGRDRHVRRARGCSSALVFGLAGDVFLLGDSDTRFRLGLAAFLVGHLAFVVSLRPARARPGGVGLGSLGGAVRLPCSRPGRWRRRHTSACGCGARRPGRALHGRDRGDGDRGLRHRRARDRRRRDGRSPPATRSWPSTRVRQARALGTGGRDGDLPRRPGADRGRMCWPPT